MKKSALSSQIQSFQILPEEPEEEDSLLQQSTGMQFQDVFSEKYSDEYDYYPMSTLTSQFASYPVSSEFNTYPISSDYPSNEYYPTDEYMYSNASIEPYKLYSSSVPESSILGQELTPISSNIEMYSTSLGSKGKGSMYSSEVNEGVSPFKIFSEGKGKKEKMGCSVCGKQFVRKQDLKRHENTHTGIKAYTCPLNCGTVFSRSDALQRHLKAKRCL